MNFKVRHLTDEEIIDIYLTYGKRHFPESELKPVSVIRELIAGKSYIGLGMFKENNSLVGYALFTRSDNTDMILLDYYAILEEYRQNRAGSKFLSRIKDEFKNSERIPAGILIETEDIEYALNEEETDIRQRRDSFYTRNNALLTGIKSFVAGVNYNIWYLEVGAPFERASARTSLEKLYREMFKCLPGNIIKWDIQP